VPLHPDCAGERKSPPDRGDLRPGTRRSAADPRPWRARVEAETRIADGQALERKLALKLRDDPVVTSILLVLGHPHRTARALEASLRLRAMLPRRRGRF
jgi:hypothetical protein